MSAWATPRRPRRRRNRGTRGSGRCLQRAAAVVRPAMSSLEVTSSGEATPTRPSFAVPREACHTSPATPWPTWRSARGGPAARTGPAISPTRSSRSGVSAPAGSVPEKRTPTSTPTLRGDISASSSGRPPTGKTNRARWSSYSPRSPTAGTRTSTMSVPAVSRAGARARRGCVRSSRWRSTPTPARSPCQRAAARSSTTSPARSRRRRRTRRNPGGHRHVAPTLGADGLERVGDRRRPVG